MNPNPFTPGPSLIPTQKAKEEKAPGTVTLEMNSMRATAIIFIPISPFSLVTHSPSLHPFPLAPTHPNYLESVFEDISSSWEERVSPLILTQEIFFSLY